MSDRDGKWQIVVAAKDAEIAVWQDRWENLSQNLKATQAELAVLRKEYDEEFISHDIEEQSRKKENALLRAKLQAATEALKGAWELAENKYSEPCDEQCGHRACDLQRKIRAAIQEGE